MWLSFKFFWFYFIYDLFAILLDLLNFRGENRLLFLVFLQILAFSCNCSFLFLYFIHLYTILHKLLLSFILTSTWIFDYFIHRHKIINDLFCLFNYFLIVMTFFFILLFLNFLLLCFIRLFFWPYNFEIPNVKTIWKLSVFLLLLHLNWSIESFPIFSWLLILFKFLSDKILNFFWVLLASVF